MRTVGSLFFALLLQAPGSASPDGSSWSILEILARSSAISKVVLLILGLFSIVSWSIIFFKTWTFRRSQRHTKSFLDVFRRSSKFSEVQSVCRSLGESPLVSLFQAGHAELTTQLRQPMPNGDPAETNPQSTVGRPTLKNLTAVDRALMRASIVEINKLENRIPFLATTASITPFIGLLGTVVGIMMAFDQIGQTGSTNLGVVAPGIADALIATAAGLAAAIPAAYFYNHLTNHVKRITSEMDDFAMEFLTITERNFT